MTRAVSSVQALQPHPTIAGRYVDSQGLTTWRPTLAVQDGFRIGTDTATADNTGCNTSKLGSRYGSPLVLSASNKDAVFENMWFDQGVDYRKAPGVQFRNCMFNGNPTADPNSASSKNPNGNHYAVNGNSIAGSGALLECCSIIPDKSVTMDSTWYGIAAVGVMSIRCYVAEGWTDCINWNAPTDNNVLTPGGSASIADYLSPTVYTTDANQGGGTSHSDAIQIANGRNHLVWGSHLAGIVGKATGYDFSHGMVVGPYAPGGIANLRVEQCLFTGGGAQLSVWPNGATDVTPIVPGLIVRNNQFDATGCLTNVKGGYQRPFSILVTPGTYNAGYFDGNTQIAPATADSSSTAPVLPNGTWVTDSVTGGKNSASIFTTANG